MIRPIWQAEDISHIGLADKEGSVQDSIRTWKQKRMMIVVVQYDCLSVHLSVSVCVELDVVAVCWFR